MRVPRTAVIALATFLNSSINVVVAGYCLPEDPCWPNDTVWDEQLRLVLSESASLTKFSVESKDVCETLYPYQGMQVLNTNAYVYAKEYDGVCAQTFNCNYKFCDASSSSENEVDVPAYSVDARAESDIVAALEFARAYNISVTVKTSGHSYAGSSNGRGSLRIWMWNYPKPLKSLQTFVDSCGTSTEHVIEIGGGESWLDVYTSVGDQRHVVGGGGLTVSAAGGWLQGVGLSSTSNRYGLGVDQVLEFRVVLANGTVVVSDACSHPDLFWALRGGGGGTWGVVTAVRYRTHPLETITEVRMDIPAKIYMKSMVEWQSWIEFWVRTSPRINDKDDRWGGYWTMTSAILYYLGTYEETVSSDFYKQLNEWRLSQPQKGRDISLKVEENESYLASRGGKEALLADANSYAGFYSDRTGYETGIASRLVSRDDILAKPEFYIQKLQALAYSGVPTFNYFLGGGGITAVDANATAINPQFRTAIWQIETLMTYEDPQRTLLAAQHVRMMTNDAAAGINHAAKDEPNWRHSLWGPHYQRLLNIKAVYDPDNTFNCFHCVGYQGEEGPENVGSHVFPDVPESSSSCTRSRSRATRMLFLLPSVLVLFRSLFV